MKQISFHRIIALLLAVLLLCGNLSAFAEETAEEGTVVKISSAEDLVALAENCRMDSWSRGVTVVLTRDIDLGGTPFSPIPTFSGVFEGNGFTIKGFRLGIDGSNQGFFRYIQEGAVVRNLTLEGTVEPANSRCQVGGLVGVNYGTVENCRFSGSVAGLNYIGGICGLNTGIITACTASGTVNGKRYTGGICGYSEGLIQNCTNEASVNTVITEGQLEVDEINFASIADAFNFVTAEDSDVVSDTGGIVGFSKGILSYCENNGKIGYPHYGYNVGGIAGRQSGYLSSCVNRGEIYGKKDIGGIIGQMEPYFVLKETHALADELNYLTALLSQTIANLRDSADNIGAALTIMQSYAGAAVGEISAGFDTSTIPEEDFWIDGQFNEEAYNEYAAMLDNINSEALAADLEGLAADMAYINAAISDGAHLASDDLERVNQESSRVVGMMVQALNGKYSVNLYEDISDTLTEEDIDGRVSLCLNSGSVSGDSNVGGIAGAMAEEYEFDMEDTIMTMLEEYVDTSSIISSTFQSKCVAASNRNDGTVESKKDNAGGIAGYEAVGMITHCENYGNITATDGGYVGGIAGRADSSIYNCYSMCSLDGDEYVGGIAGLGTRIRSCRTIVDMDNVTACFGAIAGYADVTVEDSIAGNVFVSRTLGAIDGISYEGYAEPEEYEVLVGEEDLPEEFVSLKLIFVADGETVKEIPFHYGDSLDASEIPAVPQKEGYTGIWPEFETENMTVGQTIEAVYTADLSAVASEESREGSEQPIFVLEGNFPAETSVETEPYTLSAPEVEDGTVLETWTVSVDSGYEEAPDEFTIRYQTPEVSGVGHSLELYELQEDGTWQRLETETLGSYEAFPVQDGEATIAAVDVHREPITRQQLWILLAAAAILILLIVFLIVRKKKKQKKAKHVQQTEASES